MVKNVLFLHKYKGDSENTNVYNAPQKYRAAGKFHDVDTQNDIKNLYCLDFSKIAKKMVDVIKNNLVEDLFFYAFPSTKDENKIFNDKLLCVLENRFTHSINISSCFIQKKELNSTCTTTERPDDKLGDYYGIDTEKFENITKDKRINKLLLIDDVHNTGNTFNAMALAIKEIKRNFSIIGFVILKIEKITE